MSAIRTTFRLFLTALVAIGIIGSTALLARAVEPIEFTHKPGYATFHNPNDVAVEILYGTPSSSDVVPLTLGAGETVTVQNASQNFGFTASVGTQEFQALEWPGVDLSAAKYEEQNPVTIKVSDGFVTFTNDNPLSAEVWIGAAQGDETPKYDIAPNSSIKVEVRMTNEHFVWWAEVGQVPAGGNLGGDGIDLTKYTDDDKAPVKAEPTKKPVKKPVRPSLPHTGN